MGAVIEGSIDYVLKNEGGFTDDEADSGGATNWGITHEDLARFVGHSVSTDDVRNMPKETAIKIYDRFYWNPMSLGTLEDQRIATAIFDMGVNMGISRGIKLAQQSCVDANRAIKVDGHMGPKTEAALNSISRALWLHKFHALVVDRYNSIIAHNQSQAVFRTGWLRRADRLLSLV